MNLPIILAWTLAALAVPIGLWRLHRLALRLEERGYIYYLRRKPSGSAAGGFVALQRIIEPQAEHIFVVRDEAVLDADPVDGR